MNKGKERTMQMFAKFRLINPDETETVITKNHLSYISTGGFSFNIGGKSIPFDFDATATNEEGGIFRYESGYGPFFNDFCLTEVYDEDYAELGINRADITAEFLAKATEIEEFHICYDVNGGTEDGSIGDNKTLENEFRIELLSISFLDRDSCAEYCVARNVIDRFNYPERTDKISREMVAAAYKRGDIMLIKSPHDDGVVCSIGEYWFYFGGEEAERSTVEEYKANVPEEDIVSEIYSVLEGFWHDRETFGDEYLYYKYYLKEREHRAHSDETPAGEIVLKEQVSAESKISNLIKKVRELSDSLPNDVIRDADTILYDAVEEADFEITGLAEGIFRIWDASADKKAVEELFYTFTNMQLETFLEKCISVMAKEGGVKQ